MRRTAAPDRVPVAAVYESDSTRQEVAAFYLRMYRAKERSPQNAGDTIEFEESGLLPHLRISGEKPVRITLTKLLPPGVSPPDRLTPSPAHATQTN